MTVSRLNNGRLLGAGSEPIEHEELFEIDGMWLTKTELAEYHKTKFPLILIKQLPSPAVPPSKQQG